MPAYVFLFFTFFLFPSFGESSEDPYTSHFLYETLLEPLIQLDEKLQQSSLFQITHCSIVETPAQHNTSDTAQIDESSSSDEQALQYRALGSCLYEEIPFFTEDDKPQKSIVIHTLIRETRRFDLRLTWQSISLSQLFSSYSNESPVELTNRIQITSADSHSLSEFFKYLLWGDDLENPPIEQTTPQSTILSLVYDKLQSWILTEGIGQWILDIKPSSEDLLNIAFSVVSSSGSVIYHTEFLTNYYIGSHDYFIQSKTGEKFELSLNQPPINMAADNE